MARSHLRLRISVLVPQAWLLARAPHALRWRLETFGLYMPSPTCAGVLGMERTIAGW